MKRIYHPYWDWECYQAGFFNTTCEHEKHTAEKMYCGFLSDTIRFESALISVLNEWPISCEQFLSNGSINRIAWLGQASMCIKTTIPSIYRSGFRLLKKEQQDGANILAKKYLHKWLNEYK